MKVDNGHGNIYNIHQQQCHSTGGEKHRFDMWPLTGLGEFYIEVSDGSCCHDFFDGIALLFVTNGGPLKLETL